MKSVQYRKEELTVTISEWMNKVTDNFDAPTACVLAETPRRIIFRMLREGLTTSEVTESTSCIVFDVHAELRLEKAQGATEGACRLLRDHKAEATHGYVRESRYHLRCAPEGDNTARQLVYVEYFAEEESGMLVPACARLAGLIQGGRV